MNEEDAISRYREVVVAIRAGTLAALVKLFENEPASPERTVTVQYLKEGLKVSLETARLVFTERTGYPGTGVEEQTIKDINQALTLLTARPPVKLVVNHPPALAIAGS